MQTLGTGAPGSLVQARGDATADLRSIDLESMIAAAFEAWGRPERLLLLPPDITRLHSAAGEITAIIHRMLAQSCHIDILPAIGTHAPMDDAELSVMFPGVPLDRFHVHDWRDGARTLGEIGGDVLSDLSEGKINWPVAAQIDRLLLEGDYDLIVSIGQVVPHEVAGMANHNKNLVIGVGGPDFLHQSHFLGAVYGMERIMGRWDTPVRRLFNIAESTFLSHLPIKYMLTVRGPNEADVLRTRGFFIGDGLAPFEAAARLSQQVNLALLDRPIHKAVVYLDPQEYRSTWLGNKAIYRLRMAMADDGELIILAPGVNRFGEDPSIDAAIRKYGYRGTEATLKWVYETPELRGNLAVAAHLIHGSSEGRFRVTYAAPLLGREAVEAAGFGYAELGPLLDCYDPTHWTTGWNDLTGEEFYFVENPSTGLWSTARRFNA